MHSSDVRDQLVTCYDLEIMSFSPQFQFWEYCCCPESYGTTERQLLFPEVATKLLESIHPVENHSYCKDLNQGKGF